MSEESNPNVTTDDHAMISKIETVLTVVSVLCIAVGALWFVNSRTANGVADRPVAHAASYAVRGFSRGPSTAAHTVVVFSDFECPFCRRFAAVIDSFHARRPDVRIVERHLPLTALHPSALAAALSAECAMQHGRYEEMRRSLFAHPTQLRDEEWGTIAAYAGISDTAAIVRCVASEVLASKVALDLEAARALGISSTPAVLLDTTLLDSPPSLRRLLRATASTGSSR